MKIIQAALLAAACAAVLPIQAGSITVTDSIIANGSLDGSAFSNALVTLTLTGDTSSVTSPPVPDLLYDLIGPATVTVTGTGSDSLSGTVDLLVCDLSECNPASAGFNQQIGSGPDYNIFGTIDDAAFVTYELATSIAVSGASYGNNRTWPTAGGSLVISSGVGANTSTFTAVVSSPEPATSVLLLAGLAGAWFFRRRFRVRDARLRLALFQV